MAEGENDSGSQSSTSSLTGIIVTIALALLVIVIAIIFGRPPSGQSGLPDEAGGSGQRPEDGQIAGEQAQILEVPIEDHDPVLGADEAPVVMIEFSDFECPFCKRFHETTFGALRQQYIDSGRLKVVFKDFPLSQIHPRAQAAAEAAGCAREQGKFWEYADIVFANQPNLSDEDLTRYAQETALDADQFSECVGSGDQRDAVAADQRAGIQLGITGTPSFVINGRYIEGALSVEQFTAIIDAAAREAAEQ